MTIRNGKLRGAHLSSVGGVGGGAGIGVGVGVGGCGVGGGGVRGGVGSC